MWRTRIVVGLGLAGLLGLMVCFNSSTNADPIHQINGQFQQLSPSGSGLTQVLFSRGIVDNFVDVNGKVLPAVNIGSSAWIDRQNGGFPNISVFNDAGGPTFELVKTNNEEQRAIFQEFPTSGSDWHHAAPEGFEARAFLESNTIPGLDLSQFSRGGTFSVSSPGITIDPETNTATVAEGAMASFSFTAVPEPATALLAGSGGLLGFGWLWLTRKRKSK